MKLIKTLADVTFLPTTVQKPIWAAATALFGEDWDSDANGYFIFLEGNEDLRNLPHLSPGDGLYCADFGSIGSSWEDVKFFARENLYEILVVCNNEFAVSFYIRGEDVPKDLEEPLWSVRNVIY